MVETEPMNVNERRKSLLAKSAVGRDINRHYYTPEEIDEALQRPVVQSLFELIRQK